MTPCPVCGCAIPSNSPGCPACLLRGSAPSNSVYAPIPDAPVALAPGELLAGRYRVISQLGQGGMGDVFRAEDQQLGRAVAIKMIRAGTAASPDRLARLEREARILAALNHPNVATLHGFETDAGHHFLVMELVPGENLADQLVRRRHSTGEASAIARQIAEGVEAAHAVGIIHRDLKPGNVMVTPEGRAKVLDFGLARPATVIARSDAVTIEGSILGTPGYMSPEQARGEPVDARTDVWAFGCVFFELLSGKRAFASKDRSVADAIACVLTQEPDWSVLPAGTPPPIHALLRKCLRKDARNRLHSIADARIELDDSNASRDEPPVLPAPRPSRRAVLLGMAGTLGAAGGFAGGRALRQPEIPTPPPALEPQGWEAAELVLAGTEGESWPVVSPDGEYLAYILFVGEQTQVAVLDLKTRKKHILSKSAGDGIVLNLSWDKDSRRIYFARHAGTPLGVYSVSPGEEKERLEVEDAGNPQCLSDGSLLVGRYDRKRNRYQLVRRYPATGKERVYTNATPMMLGGYGFVALPGHKEVALWHRPDDGAAKAAPVLATLDLETETLRVIARGIDPGSYGHFIQGGDDRKRVFPVSAGLQIASRVMAVPRDGSGPVRTEFAPPGAINGGSFGPDGALYLCVWYETYEVLRFPVQGGVPERLGPCAGLGVLQLSEEGPILSVEHVLGQPYVMVRTPGSRPERFLSLNEPSSLPGVVVGKEVLLMVGMPGELNPVLVDFHGSVSHRFDHVRLPALPRSVVTTDGETIYYAVNDHVWSANRDKNVEPRPVCPGKAAALLPGGQALLVAREEANGHQLWRVPVAEGNLIPGQNEQRVEFMQNPADRLCLNDFFPLEGAATSGPTEAEARIPILTMGPDSYFNIVALLDESTRKLTLVPLDYHGDVFGAVWDSNRQLLLAIGSPWQSKIWRFRPRKATP